MPHDVGSRFENTRDAVAVWLMQRFCVEPLRGFRKRLADYVFAELPARDTEDLEYHLDQCYRCRTEVEHLRLIRARFRMLGRSYRALLEKGTCPTDESARAVLAEAYMQERERSRHSNELKIAEQDRLVEECLGVRIDGAKRTPVGRRTRRALAFRTAGAVAAVLVVGIALWFGLLRRDVIFPPVSEPVSEELTLQTAQAIAVRLLIQESDIDLRTSFGPELPSIAMIIAQGLTEQVPDADVRLAERLLKSRHPIEIADPRLAAAAAVLSALQRDGPRGREFLALALGQARSGTAWLDTGVAALLLSEFETARICFSNALAADPNLKEAQYNLARLFEITDREHDARVAWRRYMQMDSTSHWSELAQGRLFVPIDKTRAIDKWPPWKD